MALTATRSDALRWEKSGSEIEPFRVVGTIDGVVIDDAAALNGPGLGTIRNLGTNPKLLSWKAPGSATFGPGIVAATGQSCALEDGEDPDKHVRVTTIDADRIPDGAEAGVQLADRYNNELGSADVTAAEATAGDVSTYTIDLKNVSTQTVLDVKVWIESPVGLEISDDGVVWVAPDSETHMDVLTFASIAASATATVHIRRTIGMGASSDPDVERELRASYMAQ